MQKFDLETMATAVRYYDTLPTFFKGDGNVLDFEEDILAKGLSEDDYPLYIEDFKKMGYGFSKEIIECTELGRHIYYTLDDIEDEIIIETENFTMKECFTIIDMVNRQLASEEAGSFVSFGNNSDDMHALYYEESTYFGEWWNDFIKLFQDRLKRKNQLTNKLKRVVILRDDYQTEDKDYRTKDRVIHIVLV